MTQRAVATLLSSSAHAKPIQGNRKRSSPAEKVSCHQSCRLCAREKKERRVCALHSGNGRFLFATDGCTPGNTPTYTRFHYTRFCQFGGRRGSRRPRLAVRIIGRPGSPNKVNRRHWDKEGKAGDFTASQFRCEKWQNPRGYEDRIPIRPLRGRNTDRSRHGHGNGVAKRKHVNLRLVRKMRLNLHERRVSYVIRKDRPQK
jgi:hypothetical protein